MQRPRFEHLVGLEAWSRCDFRETQLHASTGTVRLATREQALGGARLDGDVLRRWTEARGGAVPLSCPPDVCVRWSALVADPDGHFAVLDDHGERVLAAREGHPPSRVHFADTHRGDAAGTRYRSLSTDARGRLWLLVRTPQGETEIRLLAQHDLRRVSTLTPPLEPAPTTRPALTFDSRSPSAARRPARLVDLGAANWGVVAISGHPARVWSQANGGEWTARPLGADLDANVLEGVTVAGDGGDEVAVLLHARDGGPHRLLLVGRRELRVKTIETLENPVAMVKCGDDLWVAEAEAGPCERNLTLFSRFRLDAGGLAEEDQWGVRSFDGRALVMGPGGTPLATTHDGLRPLFRRRVALATAGRVETVQLDAEHYGTRWHRVFVDVCLPAGTSLGISARTSDELPLLTRDPTPAPGFEEPLFAEDWRGVLGSRTADDDEGWQPLAVLDERTPRADLPFPPEDRELPSDDTWADTRGEEAALASMEFVTLEGLIPNEPGRYLWLRLDLVGTGRRTPVVIAVRATEQRPSLLEHLPAFWRSNPATAPAMDRWLAQFEGLYTELDQRIEQLHQLVDPRTSPPEALEWLGGFVALSFDSRLREGVRRQLIEEAVSLYQRRGTVPGLERILSILAEAPVRLIEAFRVRRRSGAILDVEADGGDALMRSVLGPGLQLGASDVTTDTSDWTAWEQRLSDAHDELLEERDQVVAARGKPCPAADPPPPLDLDPLVSFVRPFAHRFSVLVFGAHDDDTEDLLEQALANNKPAHTVHELCWLDAGFRLGMNTYAGLGTALGPVTRSSPTVLGRGSLGVLGTLGVETRGQTLGSAVGAAVVGRDTRTG